MSEPVEPTEPEPEASTPEPVLRQPAIPSPYGGPPIADPFGKPVEYDSAEAADHWDDQIWHR